MRSSSGFLGPTPCNKVTVANLPYVNFSGPLTVDLPDISPFGAAAFHQARSHPVPDKASGARLATPSMRTNSGLFFFVLWFNLLFQEGIPACKWVFRSCSVPRLRIDLTGGPERDPQSGRGRVRIHSASCVSAIMFEFQSLRVENSWFSFGPYSANSLFFSSRPPATTHRKWERGKSGGMQVRMPYYL